MSNIHVYTLFSSSKGNATYIKAGDSEILVDAGMSARAIGTALQTIGTGLERIDAIFITHEHSDHVRGLEIITKKYHIPIHMTEITARAVIQRYEHNFSGCIVMHRPEYGCQIGNLTIRSFLTPHDSNMSVGYVIDAICDGEQHRIGIATDIGHVSTTVRDNLCGCESVILESNHDEHMLLCGSYPYALKRRILSQKGHLSNEACAECVIQLVEHGTKNILLAHLSPENNLPRLALETSRVALRMEAIGDDVYLAVADKLVPTKLL